MFPRAGRHRVRVRASCRRDARWRCARARSGVAPATSRSQRAHLCKGGDEVLGARERVVKRAVVERVDPLHRPAPRRRSPHAALSDAAATATAALRTPRRAALPPLRLAPTDARHTCATPLHTRASVPLRTAAMSATSLVARVVYSSRIASFSRVKRMSLAMRRAARSCFFSMMHLRARSEHRGRAGHVHAALFWAGAGDVPTAVRRTPAAAAGAHEHHPWIRVPTTALLLRRDMPGPNSPQPHPR